MRILVGGGREGAEAAAASHFQRERDSEWIGFEWIGDKQYGFDLKKKNYLSSGDFVGLWYSGPNLALSK